MSRILIVDDEPAIRRTFTEFLRDEHHEVVDALDSGTALACLERAPFDVVVSDIILPHGSGLDLLRRVQEMAPGTPFIVMTGEPLVETAAESLRLGATDYLAKPLEKRDLLRVVGHALRLKSLLDERCRLERENLSYRRNLERLVEERTVELRKLARAVEQCPVSILITDREGRIEFVNPRFTEVTGYAPEEVLGRNPRLLASGETPPATHAELWATILAGKVWRGEFHNRRKDGTLFWESASISPVRGAAGDITHFIAVIEDVTEKKAEATRLLRSQRLDCLGSLASGIAHDLNNILAPILVSIPLLQTEESPEARRAIAGTIESCTHRAVDIVRQLLGFGRGGDGRRVPVQIRHILRDLVHLIRETFPKGIQIASSGDPDLWPVLADPTRIHQALLNLCLNARDAMPDGGHLTLEASNVQLDPLFAAMHPETIPGPHVRIRVSDTGVGIPEDIQHRVFEAFFTTKGEGRGSGLGLATTQSIILDLRGWITLQSAPGAGSTFEIHLPASPESTVPPPAPSAGPPLPAANGAWILVIDDEPAVAEATRLAVERHGYRVVVAPHGIDALVQIARQAPPFQAVVTDYFMPMIDGATLCRSLRALLPDVPLIVTSGGLFGKAGTDAARVFEEIHVRQVLPKPYTAEVLLAAIGAALART